MRFIIGYTREPDNARYPDGVVMDADGKPSIEIATIEQLLAIQEEFGDLIIWGNEATGRVIEIYNDYRE